ncbi:glycosyl transferase [Grosmannia clavigera kw1407]|uniref:Glycosyl transferase n=1 Tax=Grosmannia clavigera (strain kw1407 / UAMH 11150) TaxID=655863 RepID=F0XHS4_GROCL|nr:glycosyl transferase [Grosmannia clavigera kw1407]EFX02832.1 glycosyl transferase [Grosmannia clavigera kw1407]
MAHPVAFLALCWALFAAMTSAYDATIYSANAWNAEAGGFQCMSITNSPPSFDARWSWPKNVTSSVHSFPYVSFIGNELPAVLSNISALQLATQWGMAPGSSATSSVGHHLDTSGLATQATKANVAFDMFLHPNASKANDATTASVEIMIWLASVGGAKALGYATNRTCYTQKMGSVDYLPVPLSLWLTSTSILYSGVNQRGLSVYTWVPEKNETSFDQDISPLLQYLWRNQFISSNLTLGLVQFGSEAYSSQGNVTFSASGFAMDLEHGAAPTLIPGTLRSDETVNNEKAVDPFDDDVASASSLPGIPAAGPEGTATGRDAEKAADTGDTGDSTGNASPKRGYLYSAAAWTRETYCPRVEAALVLPTCPTDAEKLSYVHTNRLPLYIFGIFSFFSLATGMWLFALCDVIFVWYAPFVAFVNIYLLISYLVGIVGKDWDYQRHLDLAVAHPITDETAPTVDIYLPVCMEPVGILANTWAYVVRLDWPVDKLRIHVLDDGAQQDVQDLAARFGFEYIVRDDRPRLRKAGNLRWAFSRTEGDYFVIFDADFCPRPDLIRELAVEHLADHTVAIVQSPQFFRVVPEQTWVEQGAGATQELFYRVVQVNRNRWGASICVGSNAMYRRAALEEVGGTADIGFSEDVHTGFGCVDRGWRVKYIPLCLATGVCPPTPRSFFSQQMRWARGSTTLLTNKHFWTSNLTLMQKICYMCGFFYYSAISLSIFTSPIPGIFVLAFRESWFRFYNLAFAIPSILYGLFVFRIWAKASYGLNVQHIMLIQSYACYLTAIKDRLFGIELLWAASGDAKAHKSHKYRNMRILCWIWTLLTFGGMVGVVSWRLATGFKWYNPIPLIVLNVYNTYLAHRFLFCNW